MTRMHSGQMLWILFLYAKEKGRNKRRKLLLFAYQSLKKVLLRIKYPEEKKN